MDKKLEEMKKSFAIGYKKEVCSSGLYNKVCKGLADNVKMGPFKSTSGLTLPYYLNLSTNFLDKNVAPDIVDIMTEYLEKDIKKRLPKKVDLSKQNLLCVGMEVAGGMMVTQFSSKKDSSLFNWMDFVYMRKKKKTTGTCQQLEGPTEFTSRTKDSPVLYGIWLDDCMSTGGSLRDGIEILKRDYNIEIVCAYFLVDRSKDRQNLPKEKEKILTSKELNGVMLEAIYDLKEIDDLTKK